MEFKILEIKVMENGANVRLCILKKDGLKKIPLNEPIWKGEKIHPAAFIINQSLSAALQVNVHLNGKSRGGKYKLSAYYGDTLMFSSRPEKLQHELKEVLFTVQAKFKAEEFFKVSGKLLSWKLFRNNKLVSILPEHIDLELYWIYKEDYLFYKRGIPVEILRGIAQCFRFTGQTGIIQFDNHRDTFKLEHTTRMKSVINRVTEAVVYHCFSKNPPCYDIWSSSSRYVYSCGFDCIGFYLNKYLKSNALPNATCNCVDQAAALQVYLRAVGIHNVSFCVMEPFGYLRLTNLIGRGLCNNPKYAKTEDGGFFKMLKCYIKQCNPIVAQRNEYRTGFNYHAFCALNDGKIENIQLILDSCVGPHTGCENPEKYVDKAVDNKYPIPPKVGIGGNEDIQPYKGVIKIDGVIDCQHECNKTSPEFPLTKKFIERMCLTDEHITKSVNRFVVCSWPDPRECPALAKDGWELRFEDITPGNNMVLKSWILYKEEMSIDIELYISSRRDTSAMFRFLEIGSKTNLSELPYKKGPRWLGQHSARFITRSHIQYFWIYHNVVFNITCHNVEEKKVKKIIKWLYNIERVHIKENIDKYLPSIDDITCLHTTPKKSETVTVNMKHQENILHDFTFSKDDKYEGDGLRLIDETEDSLVFEAVKKSNNKLFIVAVDKNTLLVNKKEFIIQVTKT